MEEVVTIKHLKLKNPSISNREIGRLLQMSHNTVKRVMLLASEDLPKGTKQGERKSGLDLYKEKLEEMVYVKKYRLSRVYQELKSIGYTGGKSSFYEYCSKHIVERAKKYYQPYETEVSEQAQFDWSPYTVSIGGEVVKVIVYSYILSYSRYQILNVSLSEDMSSVYEALELSIIESGGICSRIQTDNAKVFVNRAGKEEMEWNPHYLQFASHYGFKPSRSLPKKPWSKGKVEKPFQYVEDHFIAGCKFDSFEEMEKSLKVFQKQKNQRFHSTIQAIPQEKYEQQEKMQLMPLPESRYVSIKEELRKVSSDCLISFNSSRYSVPHFFVLKSVWVKVHKGHILQIYSQAGKIIAEHKLSRKAKSVVIIPEHYQGNRCEAPNLARLTLEFLTEYPDYQNFIDRLSAQKRLNPSYHLQKILAVSKLYSKQDFVEGLNYSIKYNVFSYQFIEGYLSKNHKHSFDENIKVIKLSNTITSNINIKRDLCEYKIRRINNDK